MAMRAAHRVCCSLDHLRQLRGAHAHVCTYTRQLYSRPQVHLPADKRDSLQLPQLPIGLERVSVPAPLTTLVNASLWLVKISHRL